MLGELGPHESEEMGFVTRHEARLHSGKGATKVGATKEWGEFLAILARAYRRAPSPKAIQMGSPTRGIVMTATRPMQAKMVDTCAWAMRSSRENATGHMRVVEQRCI